MVIYCSVDNCFNKVTKGLSCFRCPKDPDRCEEWKEKLGFVGYHRFSYLNSEECYKKLRICRIHFEDNCFPNRGKTRIKEYAVPTLYIGIKAESSVDTSLTLKESTENLPYLVNVSTQTQLIETCEASTQICLTISQDHNKIKVPLYGSSETLSLEGNAAHKTKTEESQLSANTWFRKRMMEMEKITLEDANRHFNENHPNDNAVFFNSTSEVDDTDDSSLFQNNQSGLFSLVETEMTGELDQNIDEKFSPSYVTTDLHIKEEPIKEEYNNLMPQYNNKKRRLSQPHFLEASGDVRPDEFDFQQPPMDNSHGDEWFHFGNNVACQLRNMPLERALVSQKRIMEILTEERIEALKREKDEQKKNDSGD